MIRIMNFKENQQNGIPKALKFSLKKKFLTVN